MARPVDEKERLRALLSLRILDTPPEAAFDELASVAASVCEAPVALVSFVDGRREWFKARVHFAEKARPRDLSFCTHVLDRRDPLVVSDLRADPRFASNPLVTGTPGFRFYAGVPLHVDADAASAVGTLCVLDHVPRELTAAQLAVLERLARHIERELRARREVDRLAPRTAPPPIHAPAVVGDAVDRWQIVRALREGASSALFEATSTLGEHAALKVMLGHWLEREEAVERFVHEATILRRLTSPHTCRILDLGNLPRDRGKLPYLALEFLAGKDLQERLDEGPIPWRDACGWLAEACASLEEAHALGIIHRDLKPSNLFLAGGTTKVLDFGIAKAAAVSAGAALELFGTLAYASPEQLIRPAEVGPAADVWSMGAVLHHLVTGEVPFPGETPLAMCSAILTHAPRAFVGGPASVEAIALRCLEKAPAARFASMGALGEALRSAARAAS